MAHMPELTQMMEAWCAAHTFEDVAREFEVHQVPYAPLMSMADIFAEPHYRQRRTPCGWHTIPCQPALDRDGYPKDNVFCSGSNNCFAIILS